MLDAIGHQHADGAVQSERIARGIKIAEEMGIAGARSDPGRAGDDGQPC